MKDKNQNASEIILNALNDVDDEMIEEASPRMTVRQGEVVEPVIPKNTRTKSEKQKGSKLIRFMSYNWKKMAAVAACLVVVVVGSSSALRSMNQSKSDLSIRDNYDYSGNLSVQMSGQATWNKGEYAEESSYGYMGGVMPGEFSTKDEHFTENEAGSIGDLSKPSIEQKLIYTANVRLETLEFDNVVREIKEKITALGGFIQSDEIYDSSNGQWYSDYYEKTKGTMTENITVRIPSDKYNEFLEIASSVNGKVTSLVQNVENITREYSDLSTTIESLKTQESRLLEMLKGAETVEDMIYIESRLSDVQNELRIYQNRLNLMDTDVTYSTIYLKIAEVVKYTNTPAPKSTFFERLQNTLTDSGEGFLNFMENSLFFVITVLPEVALVGVIVLIVVLVVKSRKKKKAVRKSMKKDDDASV